MTSVTVSSSPASLHMTSCSLTRIRGPLRVRVIGEEHRPFYPSFAISPSISLLSTPSASDLLLPPPATPHDTHAELPLGISHAPEAERRQLTVLFCDLV